SKRRSFLEQAGHELDQVARAGTVVELGLDQLVPGGAAGAGRARQAEDVGAVGDAGKGARLDGRGLDVGPGEPAKDLAEALDLLVQQRRDRLGRAVAAGDAGAAGRE